MANSAPPPAAEGRDLNQLLEILRPRWQLVLIIALLVGYATYAYYRWEAPTYTASTSVLLQPSSLESALAPAVPPGDPSRAAENQARLVLTPAVAQRAARLLDDEADPLALLEFVAAIPDPNSDFLTIQATTSDPQTAANVANAFAEGLVKLGTGRLQREAAETAAAIESRLAELTPTAEDRPLRQRLQAQLQRAKIIQTVPPQGARQVDRATPPATANGSSPARNAIFAGMLGLVLGVLLVLGLEALRRRLPSSRAEEAYALPLLSTIPFDREAAAEAQRGPGLPAAMTEPVRTLRTALDHSSGGRRPPRTILVTSAIDGEGKSTLTKCLALGYFQGGRRVLVIDGDLRRPSLHGFFDVEPEPGLTDAIRFGTPLAKSVHGILLHGEETQRALETGEASKENPETTEGGTRSGRSRRSAKKQSENGAKRAGSLVDPPPVLDLLPGGSRAPDPAALLGTKGMARVLAEAADSYDVVLIDSPPILIVSDAIPLATAVDGAIVVTRSDYTTRAAAESLRRALERRPDITVIGLVANGVRDWEISSQYHYRYAGVT